MKYLTDDSDLQDLRDAGFGGIAARLISLEEENAKLREQLSAIASRRFIQCASCPALTPVEEAGVDHICLKCEIDRLKQERDELAALVEVMRDALRNYTSCVMSVNNPNDFYPKIADGGKEARDALSITPSAALREIQARTLEDILNKFVWFSSKEGLWLADAIQAMAAAKRKGSERW